MHASPRTLEQMVPPAPDSTAFRRRQFAAAAGCLLLGMATAGAQQATPDLSELRLTQSPAAAPQDLQQRDSELEKIRAEQRKAIDAQAKLRREIASLSEDRRELNQQLIQTAMRVRDIDARIAETEKRIEPLDKREKGIQQSLRSRRAVITEVLAALQRMGRRPPPALLVRPEDALQSVRTAILLGAVRPEMRMEAETLARELSALVQICKAIATERERKVREPAGRKFRQGPFLVVKLPAFETPRDIDVSAIDVVAHGAVDLHQERLRIGGHLATVGADAEEEVVGELVTRGSVRELHRMSVARDEQIVQDLVVT